MSVWLCPCEPTWSSGIHRTLHDCRKRYLELWFGFFERRTADRAVSAVWAWGVLVQMMRDCSIIKSSRFIGDQVQGRGSTMRTDLVQVIQVRRTHVSSCRSSRISRYGEEMGWFQLRGNSPAPALFIFPAKFSRFSRGHKAWNVIIKIEDCEHLGTQRFQGGDLRWARSMVK